MFTDLDGLTVVLAHALAEFTGGISRLSIEVEG